MSVVLAIDVGLKNLAMCIGCPSNHGDICQILLWNVYDLLSEKTFLCQFEQKNKKICNKKTSCVFTIDNKIVHSCKTHCTKDSNVKVKPVKQKKVDSYLLQDIAKIIIKKLDELYLNNSVFNQVTEIIIELQPKINPKSLFFSHVIYTKLVHLYINSDCKIRFIRASQKLKAYNGPEMQCHLKNKYSQRKWLSIQYTRWFLENKFSGTEKEKWFDFFNSCKKQDDISDCLLYIIKNLTDTLNKTDKKGKCIK